MTEEEKKAAEESAVQETVQAEQPVDPIAEKDALIEKLTKDRDNYKKVALARKGKLPADDVFFNTVTDESELSVAEQVKIEFIQKEIDEANKARDAEYKKAIRERDEALLALKNRPEPSSVGGGDGSPLSVKDNILTDSQIEFLRNRAKTLGADPEKFIQSAKENFLRHR